MNERKADAVRADGMDEDLAGIRDEVVSGLRRLAEARDKTGRSVAAAEKAVEGLRNAVDEFAASVGAMQEAKRRLDEATAGLLGSLGYAA